MFFASPQDPLISTDSPGIVAYLMILIPVFSAAIVSIINAFKVAGVKQELKTMNESTLGQLGEANEARRIAEIPQADRTQKEQRHMGMTRTRTSDSENNPETPVEEATPE